MTADTLARDAVDVSSEIIEALRPVALAAEIIAEYYIEGDDPAEPAADAVREIDAMTAKLTALRAELVEMAGGR